MTASTELQTWLNGEPTGGPNGDGRYPLTYKDGLVYLVYCPEAQALNPSLAEQPIEVFTNTATAAADTATAKADLAAAAALTAQTAAANAASKATAAATSATTAAGYATTATNQAGNATTQAGIAATQAGVAATQADNAATSAAGVVTMLADGQAAIDLSKDAAAASATAASTKAIEAAGSAAAAADALADVQSTVTGIMRYRSVWDASGGTYPAAPEKGDFWKISVAGTVDAVDLAPGDQIYFGGTSWDKIDNTEQVTTVAGRIGNVAITKSDIAGLQDDLDAKAPIASPTFTGTAVAQALTLTGSATDARVTLNVGGFRRGLIAVNATTGVGSFVTYAADGGTATGQLDIGTGGAKYDGNIVWHAGNFDPSTKADRAGADFTGNVATSAELQTTAPNGIRMVNGVWGTFFRQDGNDLYVLITASGDQYGEWNTLRPMRINLATGLFYIGNGLTVTGNVSVSGSISAANITSTVVGNNIVQRNASGYILANYINTTANVATAVPSHIAIQNSSDNYIRWQTPAQFRANMQTPAIYVQSADPGAQPDGTLWFW